MQGAFLQKADLFPCDGLVYFIRAFSESISLFVCNGELMYACRVPDDTPSGHPGFKTNYLQLCMGARLEPIGPNGEVGEAQRYDFIRLIGDVTPSERLAFLNVCQAHASAAVRMPLKDFFYAVADLFAATTEQSLKNAIGLFGELSVIKEFAALGIDASARWQLSGLTTKYDLSFPEFNCEVKSTTSADRIVQLKHAQLFNDDNNYLLFVQLEENPSGQTLRELVEELYANPLCFNGLHERLELEKALRRVAPGDLDKLFEAKAAEVYRAAEINLFAGGIPEGLSALTYKLALFNFDHFGIESLCPES